MKKPIAPFKMLPVELREHLHELTGNEFKVWMAVVLHSDSNKEAFPSNELLMQETGIADTTLARAKQGLRSKKWFTSAQRYRGNGSLSSMGEKWCIPQIAGDTSREIGGIPPAEQGIGYPANLPPPEVHTLEADTEKPNTSKPQEQSERVREGTDDSLRSSSTSCNSQTESLEDSGAVPEQQQNQIIHWRCPALNDLWRKRTGQPFTKDDLFSATDLIQQHGNDVVEAILDITLNHREKSAKMVWKRFQVFVDNWQTNYDLCMAWFAVQKAKKSYPRPIPDKFDCTLTETELEAHNLKTYFREYCKNGVWELASDEWKLYGATQEHFTGALRFCCANIRRVTKQEFVDLIIEVMGSVRFAKAASASTGGFEHEDAE
jgi:hypothetical protein